MGPTNSPILLHNLAELVGQSRRFCRFFFVILNLVRKLENRFWGVLKPSLSIFLFLDNELGDHN